MQLQYAFPFEKNRYVVFRHRRPLPLPRHTTQVRLWVYGDNSTNRLKLWVKDRTGSVVQLVLGPVGPAFWHELHVNVPQFVPPAGRIWQSDGILRPPLSIEAVVLDDNPDGHGGHGVVYLDEMAAVTRDTP